ncbi:MAG: acyltransferase domain-containing protein, partial [Deltaproteobacteria bacterium]|nr:acyltransferase domain-containing protein [Deltaproteobacteria bacterium]
AMLKVLQRFGIKPDAVCGHSFGELTALLGAGWITEETFSNLSIARGDVMANSSKDIGQHRGTMLAVRASLNELADLVETSGLDIVLANKNSPDQGVISGPAESVFKFEEICKQKGYGTVRLSVSAAFHSSLVIDAYEPFLHHLKQAEFNPTNIPVYSNTTGEPYPQDRSKIIKHIAEHILHPVDFVLEIENMFASGVRTFIEVGPKSVLTGMVKSILSDHYIHAISLDTSSGKRSGISDLARSLCHLASLGHFVELKNWEHPYQEQKKQRMSVPISGANYRSESKPETHIKNNVHHQKLNNNSDTSNFTNTPMNKNYNKDPELITNALKTVQEALKTMQSLQIQTAETHKKFLEAQAENSRVLKTLVDNTRQITQNTFGIELNSPLQPPDIQNLAPPVSNVPYKPVYNDTNNVSPQRIKEESHDQLSQTTVNDSLKDKKQIPALSMSTVEQTMLEVVNQLTGYPIEMLGMDMDIEADLGIDSIKKVEILSTLEENIPNLPQISPEIIGSLKTLGQIAKYISESSGYHPVNQTETSAAPIHDKNAERESKFNANSDIKEIETILLEIVCQLTGYPEEMLGLDMDIEADLGIDSIKKVEILSTKQAVRKFR